MKIPKDKNRTKLGKLIKQLQKEKDEQFSRELKHLQERTQEKTNDT